MRCRPTFVDPRHLTAIEPCNPADVGVGMPVHTAGMVKDRDSPRDRVSLTRHSSSCWAKALIAVIFLAPVRVLIDHDSGP